MSGCSDVCLDHGYAEETEMYQCREVKRAGKDFTCAECGTKIPKGSAYRRESGKTEDWFWSEPTCSDCAEIRDAFVCGSWCIGQLWESIRECMFPIWDQSGPIDCLAKVSRRSARDKLRVAYDEWRQLPPGDGAEGW